MSLNNSTGVRKRTLDGDRITEVLQENEQNLIQSFKPFNAESPSGGLIATGNSIGTQPAGNGFIDVITSGFNGAVGYFQEQATIATEQIDIFRDNLNSAFSSNVKLIADGANDILDFITGGDLPGQILKLVGDDTLDVTINNADGASTTSNILFPGTVDDFTLKAREIIEFLYDSTLSINGNDGCWCYSLGDSTSGGGSISFPILYPQDDFGDQGAVNLNVDISGNTGQNKTVRMTGDIGFQFTSPPASTVLEEIWFTFEQDDTGDNSIVTTPTGLKNPTLLDALLDKNANAKTTFHFITEDGGTTFRAELIDLVVSSGSQTPWLSDIDASEFDLTNLDRSLFAKTVGEDLTATDVGITSDVSGNFLTNAVGEYQWLVDANVKMKLNASQLTMSANIDMENFSLFDAITVDFKITNNFDPTTLTIIGFDSFSKGLKYNSGATTTNHQFEIGGEPMVSISRLGTSRGLITTEQLFIEEFIDLASFTNPPPISDGNFWLNSSGLFQFRQNGVTVGLGGGGGSGDVTGPDGATANAIAIYNEATGKIIKNSDITINPAGQLNAVTRINQAGTVPISGFLNLNNSAAISWEASPAGTDGTLSFTSDERFLFTGGPVVTTSTQALGLEGIRWGTLWATSIDITSTLQVDGDAILNGDTNIGNAPADTLSISARIDTNLVSSGTNSLGLDGTRWGTLWATAIEASGSLQVDGNANLNGADTNIGNEPTDTLSISARIDTDLKLVGSKRIRSNDGGEIGFFVTSATTGIGTAGTNQSPVVSSLSSTVANLDAAFGSAIGCHGVYNTSSAFVNVAWKTLSNEWVVIAIPDGGGNVLGDHIT